MQASNLQGDLNIKTVWGDLIVSVSEETSSCLCLGRPHRASVWGDLIVPVSGETSSCQCLRRPHVRVKKLQYVTVFGETSICNSVPGNSSKKKRETTLC
jgi:hypothetical protein